MVFVHVYCEKLLVWLEKWVGGLIYPLYDYLAVRVANRPSVG